jgi:Tol biopolymer transport system component
MEMNRKKFSMGVVGLAVAFFVSALAAGNASTRLSQQSAEDLYQGALLKKEAEGDLNGAIKAFQDILTRFPDKRDIAAKAQLQVGACYEKLGLKQAQEAYQKVIEKYPEQSETVKAAREKLALLTRAQAAAKKGGQELSMRRVYEGTGLEWGNALSSDGRYLVYTDWDTGDLAVVDLVTTKSRQLTNNGGLSTKSGEMGETSAFSPDDKQVAYGWYNKDKVPELWVIGFDGSNPRMLCRDEKSAWIRPHDWSPDGQQILVINMKKEGSSQIALITADEGKIRVLRDVPAKDPDLDLSPDGRFVACSMAPEPSSSKRDVFIMKTEDGDMSPLIAHAADDYSLGWAPDGKTLVFASDRTGSYGLWGIGVSDGKAQGSPYLVKSTINKADPVRLAPNGALYFVLTEAIVDIYTAAIDPDTGKVQGQPTAVPTRYSGANFMPDWSPDGTRLAYKTNPGGVSGPGAPAVISIQDVRTGEERQVTPKIGSIGPNDGPRWAPDGRSVLVIGESGQETAIYNVDVSNGATSPLVIIPKFQYTLHAVWSADGKSLFYPQGNPTRILRRDLDTGKDTELASIPGPAGIPLIAASPDGKWLAFTSREEGEQKIRLKIVFSVGGEVRELFQTMDKGFFLDLNWTADSRFLWFRRVTPSDDPKVPPKWESWKISPDGGNLQKLELVIPGGGMRLHPDGRQIAFYNGRGRRDLWVMENFLPTDKVKK